MMSVWLRQAGTKHAFSTGVATLRSAGLAVFQQPQSCLHSAQKISNASISFSRTPVGNPFFTRAYSTESNLPQRKNVRIIPPNRPTIEKSGKTNALLYILSGLVFMIGASYAAVPLYKMFCEAQGLDVGTEFKDGNVEKLKQKLESMKKAEDREIKVRFVASTSADLLWKFEPSQTEISVVPGETALAFFKAKNLTDRSIIGIASYTILPFEAALYFTKIQCFCFEEQRLEPNEEVDMPVFFYIDEEYANDPKLVQVDEICLSYTFFESKGETTFAGTSIKPLQLQPSKA